MKKSTIFGIAYWISLSFLWITNFKGANSTEFTFFTLLMAVFYLAEKHGDKK